MSDFGTNPQQSNVQDMLNDIQQHYLRINTYKNKIRELNTRIKEVKQILFEVCNHEWYIDRDDCWDSICNKRCKRCKLWQHPGCN